MAEHDGHRRRMREQLAGQDFDAINDLSALEALLFYALPRKDTRPIAQALLQYFGSFSGVLDAPDSELMKVPGIGENSAALIKLSLNLYHKYLASRASLDNTINTTQKAAEYLMPFYFGRREETAYIICLDSKLRILGCRCIGEGNPRHVVLSPRKAAEAVISTGATCAILSHNHPSEVSLSSIDDRTVTEQIYFLLRMLDVELVDHIIMTSSDFTSLAEDGWFSTIRGAYHV